MKKLLIFLLFGFLLFSLLGYFCAYKILAPAIEQDIRNKTKNSLLRNDLASIEVKIEGRDISLKGIVASEELKAKAQRVAAVDGYHSIDNQIVVMQKTVKLTPTIVPSYKMIIKLKRDHSIVLSGMVSTVEEKNKLVDLAKKHYGKAHVTDDLSLKKHAPLNWEKTLSIMLNAFTHLQQGQMEIINNKFKLTGLTDSEASRQKAGLYLEDNLPKNYTGNFDIVIATDNKGKEKKEVTQDQVIENCQKEFKHLLSKNKVHFKTGRADLINPSSTLLDQLVLIAKSCPKAVIKIEGYTDSKGSTEKNKQLSQQRAEAVAHYLQQKGMIKTRLKAKGYGEEKPIASNKTSKGRALNRRIEFIVKGIKE